jgi:hypothetical protein
MKHEEFEKIVMNKLLEGKSELLELLRNQYLEASITSREFTSCGFFTYFDVPESMSLDKSSGRIDDVKAEFINYKGDYLFFILYIENGKFDVLECFTTQDSWEQDYNVLVDHCYKGERRFEINNQDIIINIK